MWCVFSIRNEYDQPMNNLEIIYEERPTIEILLKDFSRVLDVGEAAAIICGEQVRVKSWDSDFRLQEVQFKERLENPW